MIVNAAKVFAQQVHDLIDFGLGEVCVADDVCLSFLCVFCCIPIKLLLDNKRPKKSEFIISYLNLNASPSSSVSLGTISKMPLNGNGWPP